MSTTGPYALGGLSAERATQEREILFGVDALKFALLAQPGILGSGAVDAGNTPTTDLRAGLLLGINSSTNEYEDWNPDATDGTEWLAGVLADNVRTLDLDGTAADRQPRIIVGGARLKTRRLLIEGTAFLSSTDRYLARRALAKAGFVLDDDPFNYLSGLNQRVVRVTGAAAYAITAAQNGSLIIFSNVAAVAPTLPTILPGLEFDILREGDEEIVLASAEGDNMIFGNDLSGDSITFTVAGEHIGARIRVKSLYVGGVLKWLPEIVQTPFGVDAGSAVTMALAT